MSAERPPDPANKIHAAPDSASGSDASSIPGVGDLPGRRSLWRVVRWFVLLFFVAGTVAGLLGYWIGAQQRQAAQQEAVRQSAKEQFDLAEQDIQASRFTLAQQRLQYVIRVDPGYPNAADKLAQVLVALNQPTSEPTPNVTATPNLAPVKDLLSQAQAAIQAGDWTTAIDTLVLMRSKDAGYQAVARDDLMFVALRNRGINLISKQGQLEQGIYDLTRAAAFGPLDQDAINWRSWAELYLQADSYMGLNWAEAATRFAQVYLVAPYLANDAYLKYATSAQNYGDQLAAGGDPCGAESMYKESLKAWDNATLYPTATKAHHECEKKNAPPPKPKSTATSEGPTTTPPPADTPTPGGGNGGNSS